MPRLSRVPSLLLGLLLALAPRGAAGQGIRPVDPNGLLAGRSQLESLAVSAERQASSLPAGSSQRARRERDVRLLRERLRGGDFNAGDRVFVELLGEHPYRDTVIVRDGRTIQLPDMPAFSVAGVLRSELPERVRSEVARYVRDPQLRVVSLIRIAVTGEVTRPGFFSLPSDVPLSDAVMQAGGPTSNADLRKLIVRRDSEVLYDGADLQEAVRSGDTVDQLGLRPGDELHVGTRRQSFMQSMIPIATLATAVVALVATLAAR